MSTRPVEPSGLLVGPWVQAFWCLVPVQMRSKSNFRRGVKSAAWRSLQGFEEDLTVLLRAACPPGWSGGTLAVPLPQRPAMVSFIFAQTSLDTANLSKSVLDAAEGIVYPNDAAVRSAMAMSTRSRTDQWGVVGFARLTPSATLQELSAATGDLADSCLALI